MSRFEYTLPSGATFVVNGPANATQAQADRIFYEQVAAGSLVGYTAGQTLTSQATKLTKFELSRLDRGTAGVDNTAILAINQILSNTQATTERESTVITQIVAPLDLTNNLILAAADSLPSIPNMPVLTDVPLTNPIDEADVILAKGEGLGPLSIGILTPFQTQKLLAQTANLVDQPYDTISQEKGIGQYGFTAYALEQAGYVKPGTSDAFFTETPTDFVSVMSSPSVWTGKDGINVLDDLLISADTQSIIQTNLMQQSYDSLQAAGVIVAPVTPSATLSSGTVYTDTGLQSISGAPISSLSTISSGAVNPLNTGVGNLGTLANLNINSITGLLSKQITGDVGALLTNASKFGTLAVDLWAQSGKLTSLTDLVGTNLGSIGTKIANIDLTGTTDKLTNLIPGSFDNLTANLDIFGKAGQFATNFSDSLKGLTNFSSLPSLSSLNLSSLNLSSLGLGNLSGLGLGNLSGLSSLNLTSLTSLSGIPGIGNISGLLGNLGGLANLGALGDLFGGGGDLVSGTQVAGGYNNTTNRKTLDAAFTRLLGSRKIPTPVFEYPSLPSISSRLDIAQAQTFLKNLESPSSTSVFGQTIIG
jgi:hypothetical protein